MCYSFLNVYWTGLAVQEIVLEGFLFLNVYYSQIKLVKLSFRE